MDMIIMPQEGTRSIRKTLSLTRRRSLRSGYDRDDRGWTLLHILARRGNLKQVIIYRWPFDTWSCILVGNVAVLHWYDFRFWSYQSIIYGPMTLCWKHRFLCFLYWNLLTALVYWLLSNLRWVIYNLANIRYNVICSPFIYLFLDNFI